MFSPTTNGQASTTCMKACCNFKCWLTKYTKSVANAGKQDMIVAITEEAADSTEESSESSDSGDSGEESSDVSDASRDFKRRRCST